MRDHRPFRQDDIATLISALGHVWTGAPTVREWPSPGGLNSGPYGIGTVADVIWYSESGVHPTAGDELRGRVRFAGAAIDLPGGRFTF